MQTIHNLKTDPAVFQMVIDRRKPWEIRQNDRDFRVGDRLFTQETRRSYADTVKAGTPVEFTGRSIGGTITYILDGYGMLPGWVIMTVEWDY